MRRRCASSVPGATKIASVAASTARTGSPHSSQTFARQTKEPTRRRARACRWDSTHLPVWPVRNGRREIAVAAVAGPKAAVGLPLRSSTSARSTAAAAASRSTQVSSGRWSWYWANRFVSAGRLGSGMLTMRARSLLRRAPRFPCRRQFTGPDRGGEIVARYGAKPVTDKVGECATHLAAAEILLVEHKFAVGLDADAAREVHADVFNDLPSVCQGASPAAGYYRLDEVRRPE